MSLATAGVGAGAMPPVMNMPPPMMSGNAVALHQAPPTFGAGAAGCADACCGAGGAYDLRGQAAADAGPQEDLSACLGVALGATTYSACLYLADKGAVPLTGRAPLPAALWLDPKTGARGLRKWAKRDSRSGALPKAVTVGLRGEGEAGLLRVPAGMRLLGARHRPGALLREAAAWPVELVEAARGDDAADDTSGVHICLPGEAGQEWRACEPEHLLAALLVSLRLKAAAAFKVECVTCNFTVPAWFGDAPRVALQRAVFLAGMRPARFVSAPLAAAVGALHSEKGGLARGADGGAVAAVRVGGGGAGAALLRRAAAGALETAAVRGDAGAGGGDMDYLLARALQAALEDAHGAEAAQEGFKALVAAARSAREALSEEAEATVHLPAGSLPSQPEVEFTTKVSRGELEQAVAPLLERISEMLRDIAAAAAGGAPVRTVVVSGGVALAMPALQKAVAAAFPKAEVTRTDGTEAARGAALLLASERGVLRGVDALAKARGLRVAHPLSGAAAVQAADALPLQISLVTGGGSPEVLFAQGTRLPATTERCFDAAQGHRAGTEVRAVQTVDAAGSDVTAALVTVADLGDPLNQYDDRGYPALATYDDMRYPALVTRVTLEFTVDECGILSSEVKDVVVPVKKSNDKMKRMLNALALVAALLALIVGGYFQLQALAEKPAKDMARAREKLTKFYEVVNPAKLTTVEDTVKR
ncbi:Hsp70 protein-domain-containing protein [Tribonema minus]|uniref:Hsp70 protein-domain-containing protein n=1 Tax=Tribonema minus TaxID=303371 RepID=A0A835Z170_9STRA|nr:Hsp70 protein-domain-containing protein [Tribonema minus]